jgi:hypothetical protein
MTPTAAVRIEVFDDESRPGFSIERKIHVASGREIETRFLKHGRPHRDEGPALIVRTHATGRVVEVQHFVAGQLHHPRDAAVQKWDGLGNIVQKHWYEHGVRHRADGPAIMIFGANESLAEQQWFRSGLRHRDDGPAVVTYLNDRFHRTMMPFTVSDMAYYINGKEVEASDLPKRPAVAWRVGACAPDFDFDD